MVDCDEAPAFARAHPGAKKEVPRLYASAWGGAPSSQVPLGTTDADIVAELLNG